MKTEAMNETLPHLSKNNPETPSEVTSDLNKVLRGEISAVEAYTQVMDRFKDDPEIYTIRQILMEHQNSVATLKKHIANKFDNPETDSGIWGTFVTTVVGTAKTLGETATIQALIEGEEHGLDQYTGLLENENLSFVEKNLISTEFIPRQEEHIFQLRAMIKN